jgi:hypothetical protein
MTSFLTMGDFGDVIYLLPCLKLCAPSILYAKDGLRLHDPFIPRLPAIQRLVRFQPYAEDILPWEGEEITHDVSRFRDHGHPYGVTLARLQADSVGLLPDLTQSWLFTEPALETKGKIVIARSARYQNHYFPWRQLLATYGDRMLFIGHRHEYEAFRYEVGPVPYLPTCDLYEAAQAIAGSDLFIGNQSSPFALAEGLKHPSILEVCLESPDCLYRRHNVLHCHDGALDLNLYGRTLHVKPVDLRPRATRNETPPGGWRVRIGKHSAVSYSFDQVIADIRMKLGDGVPENLWDLIVEQSSVDMPPSEPEYLIRRIRTLM